MFRFLGKKKLEEQQRIVFQTTFQELLLNSLMGGDLGNICAQAERQTCEKFVNENVDYFTSK
jgi:hypothetical protein